jgi:hypothetical protein
MWLPVLTAGYVNDHRVTSIRDPLAITCMRNWLIYISDTVKITFYQQNFYRLPIHIFDSYQGSLNIYKELLIYTGQVSQHSVGQGYAPYSYGSILLRSV